MLCDGIIPVCTLHDTLCGVENFQAVVGAAEKHIKGEFHVSERDLKLGSLFAPRRKDHAAIDRNPRLPEAQFAFLADVTVHLLALHRRAYEAAIGTESPSMIAAAMHSGVASVPHPYPNPTIWTYVQRHVHRTIRRTPDRPLTHTHLANNITTQ